MIGESIQALFATGLLGKLEVSLWDLMVKVAAAWAAVYREVSAKAEATLGTQRYSSCAVAVQSALAFTRSQ